MNIKYRFVASSLPFLLLLFSVAAPAMDHFSDNAWRLMFGSGNPIYNSEFISEWESIPGIVAYKNSLPGDGFANSMLASSDVRSKFDGVLPSAASFTRTANKWVSLRSDTKAMLSDDALASTSPSPYGIGQNTWVAWGAPFFSWDRRRSDGDTYGYNLYSGGGAVGVSRLFGDSSFLGVAAGYDYRKQTMRDGLDQRIKADAMHLALYGGTAIDAFFIDAHLGWSRAWQRSDRNTAAYGLYPGEHLTGDYHDDVYSAGAKVGYVWTFDNEMRLIPTVGLDYNHVRQSAMNEGTNYPGGYFPSAALSKSGASYDSVRVPVMLAVNRTFETGYEGDRKLWTPEIRGGWVPRFGPKRATVDVTTYGLPFNAGNPATASIQSIDPGTSYGTVGAGLAVQFNDRFGLGVDYDFLFGSRYTGHNVGANVWLDF